MPYTLEDFDRDFWKEHHEKFIKRLTPKERLEGLTPEQLAAALTPEQRDRLRQQLLTEEKPPQPKKRRKK